MKIIRIVLTPVLLISLYSCGPQACIDASSLQVYSGQKVKFNSCSQNTSGVEWDYEYCNHPFGTSSWGYSENSLTLEYTCPGTYQVTITAYSRDNLGLREPDRDVVSIEVKDACYRCKQNFSVYEICGSDPDSYDDHSQEAPIRGNSIIETLNSYTENGYVCTDY